MLVCSCLCIVLFVSFVVLVVPLCVACCDCGGEFVFYALLVVALCELWCGWVACMAGYLGF